MGAWKETERTLRDVPTDVVPFPRAGFILNDYLCRAPSADGQGLCFRNHGHDGEHAMESWQGCRMRVPFGDGTVPFGGFAW